jgi:hypothetical protein
MYCWLSAAHCGAGDWRRVSRLARRSTQAAGRPHTSYHGASRRSYHNMFVRACALI